VIAPITENTRNFDNTPDIGRIVEVARVFRDRRDHSPVTAPITENTRNFDNTPDIGFQIGWAYSPAFVR